MDLRQFTTTLLTPLEQIEAAQAALYEAQTWLLENSAPLCILANQNTASNHLSNHHLGPSPPVFCHQTYSTKHAINSISFPRFNSNPQWQKDKRDKAGEKAKKKKTSLKVRCIPKSTPPILSGPAWCAKEVEWLQPSRALTSLQ